jgi:hypothetical protein
MTVAQILKHDFSKGNLYLYDDKGKEIYREYSNGYWCKREYNVNSNEIYFENSTEYWFKKEFDSNGNKIYFEDSKEYWWKREFDSNGKVIYYEDSNGAIIDKRPKGSCNDKVVEIDGKKYKLTEI